MKAKFYELNDKMEIRLSDDVQIFSKEDESEEAFIKRATAAVEKEYAEVLEITHQVDIKKMKKRVSAQIEHRLTLIPYGIESQMMVEVLISRGIKAKDIPDIKYNEPEKVKEIDVVEPKKADKDKPSFEVIFNQATEAKKNVGKTIKFQPFRKQKVTHTGTIKSVWIDRRVPMALYKIEMSDKTTCNKTIDSDGIISIK